MVIVFSLIKMFLFVIRSVSKSEFLKVEYKRFEMSLKIKTIKGLKRIFI